jgi:hypothetical protein
VRDEERINMYKVNQERINMYKVTPEALQRVFQLLMLRFGQIARLRGVGRVIRKCIGRAPRSRRGHSARDCEGTTNSAASGRISRGFGSWFRFWFVFFLFVFRCVLV